MRYLLKEKHCGCCVHCEVVHGLDSVVLICAHRPGFRGLWVAVRSSSFAKATEDRSAGGELCGPCARFKLRGDIDRSLRFTMLRCTSHRSGRDDSSGVRVVPLSQGKFALVDGGDYAAVMRYSWYAQKSYERRDIRRPGVQGIREIKISNTTSCDSGRMPELPFTWYAQRSYARRDIRRPGVQGIREIKISNTTSCDSGRMPELPFTWYAVRKDGGRTVRMHREIMGAAEGQVVDHINHDGLDNRRCNLRVCSHAENVRNQRGQRGRSSGYKGVSRDRRLGKWRAQIWHNGKHTYLGLFESEAAAARAYNAKARDLFGAFAYLNEVGEQNLE